MGKVFSIRDWEKVFETYETRKIESLKWVPVPNKHDGLGFRRIAASRDRSELFAAWNLILQIASKGRKSERGKLTRDGHPLTASDFALMTGFPESIFSRALSFFSTEVHWLIAEDDGVIPPTATDPASNPDQSPASPADSPAQTGFPPAEGRKEGMEGISLAPRASAESEFEIFYSAYPRKKSKGQAWRAWKNRKPDLQVCLEAISRLKRSDDWRKEGGMFIPYPATWLNAAGWEDVAEIELGRRGPRRPTAVPGETLSTPAVDPDGWEEYTAENPSLQGRRFTDLNTEEQEFFHMWAMDQLREAFENERQGSKLAKRGHVEESA